MNAYQVMMLSRMRSLTPYADTIHAKLCDDTRIVGGLVLQTIVGDRWRTDIDIFTRDRSFTRFDFGVWDELVKHDSAYFIIPGVVCVYHGKIDGMSVDIIHVTSWAELWHGFDFDFCKVWYDGKTIGIECPESVLTRSCVLRDDIVAMRKVDERIPKYTARGFTIVRKNDDSAIVPIL